MFFIKKQVHHFESQQSSLVKGRISAIVPIHSGREESVLTTLSEVSEQSFPDLEIIVVGSGVSSLEIPESLKNRFKFLPVEKNLGAAFARNHGAINASGEVLWFIDSDVYGIQTDCAESSYEILKTESRVGALGGLIFDEELVVGRSSLPLDRNPELVEDDFVNTACVFIPMEVYKTINGFTDFIEYPFDDVELGYKIRRHGYRCLGDRRSSGRHPMHRGVTTFFHEFMAFHNLMTHLFINYTARELFILLGKKSSAGFKMAAPNTASKTEVLRRRFFSLLGLLSGFLYLILQAPRLITERSRRQRHYRMLEGIA